MHGEIRNSPQIIKIIHKRVGTWLQKMRNGLQSQIPGQRERERAMERKRGGEKQRGIESNREEGERKEREREQ